MYFVVISKSRRIATKRAAGRSCFRPAAAPIDQVHAATPAKYRAGLPPDRLIVQHRDPASPAASSAELCS
jgi:hypothetical protein